jgi:hypothetical protein
VFWICLGYGVNMRDETMRAAAEQRLLKLTIKILSCQEKNAGLCNEFQMAAAEQI